jgi:UDP-3-O-[3-hydroxymyristoyl] N-acetylglucosamine deacetylase
VIYTRRTVASAAEFEGLGLHTGVPVKLTVHPGDKGIAFRYETARTEAIPANVTDTRRSTKLGDVGTIEHILSALAGLEITDVEIELSAPEVPGMDGSAAPFVEGLSKAGFVQLGDKEIPSLYSRIFLQELPLKIAVGKGNGHWRYEYETGERWPGSMHFESTSIIDTFTSDIAPARTFVLTEEFPMIEHFGLGKGLTKDDVIILGEKGFENHAKFPDEPARHKLLDMLGDLYLSGIPARFLNVVGTRNGHTANVKMAAMMHQAITR